jgi:glucose dehydrogenase
VASARCSTFETWHHVVMPTVVAAMRRRVGGLFPQRNQSTDRHIGIRAFSRFCQNFFSPSEFPAIAICPWRVRFALRIIQCAKRGKKTGVSYWKEPHPDPSRPCQSRIFQGVLDGRLEALDARTGNLCAVFAAGGTIKLNDLDNGGIGDVNVTSAPVVFEDLVIVGSAISDNHRTNMPSGFVRAFDVRTGRERWHWSPIPEASRDRVGGGNVWASMSLDAERGVLYAPTTSPSPDFWGGLRTDSLPGVDAIVALNVRTGALIWQYQTVHHNLWDYDLPAQPTLVDIRRDGRTIPAVVQPTKTGFLFVLNRETGEPLFPTIERGVPISAVTGEHGGDATDTTSTASLGTAGPDAGRYLGHYAAGSSGLPGSH